MKVLKPLRLGFLFRTFEHKHQFYFVPTIMAVFPFAAPKALRTEVELWKLLAGELGRFGVFDHGMSKQQGELLVTGACHSPSGQPVPWCHVRVSLGSIDKTLFVIGDRTWGPMGPTDPVPFTRMPVDYAHTFGGENYPENPIGKGFVPLNVQTGTVHPLPNIEHPDDTIKSKGDRPPPASLGPWDITWPRHFARMGTHDERWLREQFPGLALDLDWSVFNVAPVDQRIPGYFAGGEAFCIENMHPEKARIEGTLPGVVARCFVKFQSPHEAGLIEIPTRLDTVHLFPHREHGVLLFRGLRRIHEHDAADIAQCMIALEDRDAEPRMLAHYETVLARRLDRKKAHLYMLRDSDLMPASLSTTPSGSGIDEDAFDDIVRQEHLLMKSARRRVQRELEIECEKLRSMGLTPENQPDLDLPPEEEQPSLDDLPDFAEKMEAEAEAQGARARENIVKSERQLRALCEERGIDYDEIAARNQREQGGPPRFSADAELERMRDMATLAENAGMEIPGILEKLADPEFEARLREVEEATRQIYRLGAHLGTPSPAMEAAESERARREIAMSRVTGMKLAGRDFTGVDLSGMDLSGVDLEAAFLEGANLRATNLKGAQLRDAVLARTDLTGAKLAWATLAGANLGRANARGADFSDADLGKAILHETDLRDATLERAKLDGANLLDALVEATDFRRIAAQRLVFMRAKLSNSRFTEAKLHQAMFIETDVSGVDFKDCVLTSATFVTVKGDGAVFEDAVLSNTRIVHGSSFERADFSGATMTGSNLRGTKLAGSNFSNADLTKSDLGEADLTGANLHRTCAVDARFVRTNLTKATMVGANLMMAVLHNARLPGADMRDTSLFAADLTRAAGDETTRLDGANVKRVVRQASR